MDKLQHFVLDECDKCLDKVDMRKDRNQSAVASYPQSGDEMLSGCPANLYGFTQEEAGLPVENVSLHWCRWSCGSHASASSACSQVMMFSATMSAETRALCKKSQSLTMAVA